MIVKVILRVSRSGNININSNRTITKASNDISTSNRESNMKGTYTMNTHMSGDRIRTGLYHHYVYIAVLRTILRTCSIGISIVIINCMRTTVV